MHERTESFGMSRRIHLATERSKDRLRIRLMSSSGASFRIDFRARSPAALRVSSVCGLPKPGASDVPHCWAMTLSPQCYAWTRDPFLLATRWAYRAMFPRAGNHDARDPNARGTMRAVYAALAGLAHKAATMCEPASRATAMRFPPHVRLWLYGLLIADSSGRIAQLAIACPGALIFAFGLERAGSQVGAKLRDDVVRGRRLDRALADAVEAWASDVERSTGASEHPDPVWERLRWAFGAERERLHARQQLLVRRAGPMVATTNLFLPPPISFAPEDIPRTVRDNARWFSMVKCSRLLLAAPPQDGRERLERFSAFVSRNALALARTGGRRTARTLVASLHDYATAMNRWPVRATNASRFFEQAKRRRQQMMVVREVHELEQLDLPEPPVRDWREGGSVIVPIVRGSDLIREGNRMCNCVVAVTHRSVALGRSAVYHATIDHEPLTIEIARSPSGWRLVEAKGFANREPTLAEWAMLRRWETDLP